MNSYLSHLRDLRPIRIAATAAAVSLLMLQSNFLPAASANNAAQTANQPPVAVDDSYSIPTDDMLIVESSGLLENDTDADGDTLVVYSWTAPEPAPPAPGILAIDPDGSFMFDPASGFIGEVTFTYLASDQTSPESGSISQGPATVTIEVMPPNNPPVADAGGPYIVAVGGTVTLDASGSMDPDGNPLTFFWNLDDDGSFDSPGDATGVSVDFDTSSLIAPTSWFVSVLVMDSFGDYDTASATIEVTADVPSVAVSGDTVTEGETATVQVTIADSTPGDTHVAAIDWGDGAPAQDLGEVASPLSLTRLYADDGAYNVQVTVTDSDGNVATDSATVTVNNLAPVVSAGPDVEIETGDEFSLSGSFSDAGVNDTHSSNIHWGDGSNSVGVISSVGGSGTVTGSHVFAAAGEYMVTLNVVDDEGDSGMDRLNVVVTDPQPEPNEPEGPNNPDEGDGNNDGSEEGDEGPEEPNTTREAPSDEPTSVVEKIIDTFAKIISALVNWLKEMLGGWGS